MANDTPSLTRELETSYPSLTWRLLVWEKSQEHLDRQRARLGYVPGYTLPDIEDTKYSWCIMQMIDGRLRPFAANVIPLNHTSIVQSLRDAVQQIEDWPYRNIPGTLSRSVNDFGGHGLGVHSVTAYAQGIERWITWRLVSNSLRLSPAQALRLAKDLEEALEVVEEMIDFLESMEQN